MNVSQSNSALRREDHHPLPGRSRWIDPRGKALTYNDLRAAGRVQSAGQGLSHRSIQPVLVTNLRPRRGHGQLEVRHVCSS
jgi:hypothetical protein